MRQLLFFALSMLAIPVQAISISQLEHTLPKGSRLALYVIEPQTQKVIARKNESLLFPPASTQKLFTALAAELYLDDDFTFQTKLSRIGNDFLFTFSGDPTFTRQHLQKMIKKSQSMLPRKIKGDIWLDQSVFSGYNLSIGLPWDILGVCYSAPATAITLNGNCVQGSIYPQKDGSTRTYVPKHQPITLSTDAITVSSKEQSKTFCDLELIYKHNNSYHLQGCLQDRKTPLPLNFAVQDPIAYFSEILRKELKVLGIQFSGQIIIGRPEGTEQLITTHHSVGKKQIIQLMLKESDNLVSDNLLKYMGHLYHQQSGTFANGVDAVKQILLHKTGVDLTHSVLVDGSGLSRNNRVTANQLMALLQWTYKHLGDSFFSMFPTSGIDGTLKYRRSLLTPSLKNRLKLKTGSLFASHNLAGKVQTKSGKELLVVQFVSDYYVPELNPQQNPPIQDFERQLFTDLVKENF